MSVNTFSTGTLQITLCTSIITGLINSTWEFTVLQGLHHVRHHHVLTAHLQKYHGNLCDIELHVYHRNTHELPNVHMVKHKFLLKYKKVG